jgi:hypothetical protein
MIEVVKEIAMRKVMRIILTLMIVVMAVAQPVQADRGGHGGGHGGGNVGVGVYLGPGWWGPGWWGPYPYYPYYPYYYSPPPVIVEQPQEMYVQPAPSAEATRYWYYCKDPQGYYPTVKKCPDGWLKVVPPSQSPEEEE